MKSFADRFLLIVVAILFVVVLPGELNMEKSKLTIKKIR